MKATTLLKNDHTKVKGLFREYQQTGERAFKSKSKLFDKIRQELEVHSEIEEEIFYPAVREARTRHATELVSEAVEEHAAVKRLLEELSELTAEEEEFESKMSELIESVKEHASEEESEMFPEAQKHFSGEELEELGRRLEERKRELTRSKRGVRPAAARPRA